MTTDNNPYSPIDCEFHDLLEALATTRRPARIRFREGPGDDQLRMATVVDLYASYGVEYLSLSTGEILRLDQLIEVDGEILAKY